MQCTHLVYNVGIYVNALSPENMVVSLMVVADLENMSEPGGGSLQNRSIIKEYQVTQIPCLKKG